MTIAKHGVTPAEYLRTHFISVDRGCRRRILDSQHDQVAQAVLSDPIAALMIYHGVTTRTHHVDGEPVDGERVSGKKMCRLTEWYKTCRQQVIYSNERALVLQTATGSPDSPYC